MSTDERERKAEQNGVAQTENEKKDTETQEHVRCVEKPVEGWKR